jgi:SAM-dependent methyltransferase
MSLRFHEISEANHRILNPFTEEKLLLLGDICGLSADMTQLDLCCGKAEMLCQWAKRYGLSGVGVDISSVFLEAARQRAAELEISDKLNFIQQDAAQYPQKTHAFDVVSCIGATWIGNGLVGTLELMKRALKFSDSLLLVGEPYWIDPPPPEAYAALEVAEADFTSLDGTLERIESVGVELVEMVLADPDSWDRYAAGQWLTVSNWLRENPDDPDAPELRRWCDDARRSYLKYGRRYFGWGVFVLRPIA